MRRHIEMATEAKKRVAKLAKVAKRVKPAKPSKAIKAKKAPATKTAMAKSAPSKVTVSKKPVAKAPSVKAAPVAKPVPAPKAVLSAKIPPVAKAPPIVKSAPTVAKAPVAPVKPGKPMPKAEVPFSEGDYVVYPTHGVGRVRAIEKQSIAGHELELFVITFDRDRMTLRVPVPKAKQSGLRKLSSRSVMDTALSTLRGRARVKRTMWSRRAQEYEAKINSGDPVSIAEVVRDLHRHANQPDQSYSERQIYEAALERLASELAAVDGIERDKATQKLEMLLDAA